MAKKDVKKLLEKNKGFWSDFKAFAFKGNVVDMAVGVIIATAFSKIVTSLVNDLIMPAFAWLIGSMDFSQWNIALKDPVLDAEGNVVTAGVTLLIGSFILNVVNFIIIAFVIFLVIRAMGKMIKKRNDAAPPAPPEPSKEELLLTEIRDLLKK